MNKELDNKYSRIYHNLINNRQTLGRKFKTHCGLEKHHILPKSLGGSNKKDNIVLLTPREHCIAHMLLVRMYTSTEKAKMVIALQAMMCVRNKNRQAISSRMYETLRREYQKRIAEPEYREYRSELTRKQWTPERRAAVAAKAKEQWASGPKREIFSSAEYKEKKSKQMLERWQRPEYIEEMSNRAKKQWEENKFGRKKTN